MAEIIDGKAIAKKVRVEVAVGVARLKEEKGIAPKLTVILVGEDEASQIYVRNKEKACAEAGITTETLRIPLSIKQNELVDMIKALNKDSSVHGILVQLPLPAGYDTTEVLDAVSAEKDVDGIHPLNMGKLLRGENPTFVSCTPAGIIELILSTGVNIKGTEAVVVGRSNIVGKPVALLLLQHHATVTICHSRTIDLPAVTRRADILVAAVGTPEIIKKEMVRTDAIVIDVGMNRLSDRLVGDVDFKEVSKVASYITPVPGGVGPMTIAMLLKNTLKAAQLEGKSFV